MLDASIGKIILNGLFGQSGNPETLTNKNPTSQRITFGGDLYLGLLTQLPKENHEAYAEGNLFSEPSDKNYMRIKLNQKSVMTKTNFIAHAKVGAEIIVDGNNVKPASIENQSLIMFPKSNSGYEIVGFGIFRSNVIDQKTLPFLWGPVTADGGGPIVSVEKDEVPIIRVGGFKVSLV